MSLNFQPEDSISGGRGARDCEGLFRRLADRLTLALFFKTVRTFRSRPRCQAGLFISDPKLTICLTYMSTYDINLSMATTYSTSDAAKRIGVSRQTLQSWIDKKSIPTPALEKVGRVSIRLWTTADIERARKFKGTLKPGRNAKSKK